MGVLKSIESVGTKIASIFIYSCYTPLRKMLTHNKKMQGMLVSHAGSRKLKILVSDFNKWIVDWGSETAS